MCPVLSWEEVHSMLLQTYLKLASWTGKFCRWMVHVLWVRRELLRALILRAKFLVSIHWATHIHLHLFFNSLICLWPDSWLGMRNLAAEWTGSCPASATGNVPPQMHCHRLKYNSIVMDRGSKITWVVQPLPVVGGWLHSWGQGFLLSPDVVIKKWTLRSPCSFSTVCITTEEGILLF